MKYGYKTRNDQKGSKMAAKSKMATENDVFIILCQLYEIWVSYRFYQAELNEIWLQNEK